LALVHDDLSAGHRAADHDQGQSYQKSAPLTVEVMTTALPRSISSVTSAEL
jgi:hypothetical protein